MIQKGRIVKSDSGRRIRVDCLINAGGQGEAYCAVETNSGQKGVLKVFHKQFMNCNTIQRLRFLVEQHLAAVCPVLCAPTDMLSNRTTIGHYAPFAPGQPLEELLSSPNMKFMEGLQLAITLARAIGVMHKRQIAHGDLQALNLIINRVGSVIQLYVIDFDNFNAPGVPAPPMIGQNLYLAPELRKASASNRPAIPDVYTDRFAMGVLMHEIILLRHVAAGADSNENDFQKAMCSGRWVQDPAVADRPSENLGGYPVQVLNADLSRLFRSAMSCDPAERPSAEVWEMELVKAFKSVYSCPSCGGPCIVDVSKMVCPLCKKSFPALEMFVRPTRRMIKLVDGSTAIGRRDLGGSMKVSAHHAVFCRIGPETWLESYGINGTQRWNGSSWVKLSDRKPVLVQNGDELRLGDVEVQLNYIGN